MSATVEASNFKFGTFFCIWWVEYQKTAFRSRPKLAGVGARETSQKVGTSYLFMQPLKLATKFGTRVGFGE